MRNWLSVWVRLNKIKGISVAWLGVSNAETNVMVPTKDWTNAFNVSPLTRNAHVVWNFKIMYDMLSDPAHLCKKKKKGKISTNYANAAYIPGKLL